jgi:sugar O-acyltransferase (sialic acid O-acetyltransferase NeuD family)
LNKILGIFGGSGFAREVADIADLLGFQVRYVLPDGTAADPLLQPEEVMYEGEIGKDPSMQFAIGIGDNHIRQKIATRYASKLTFANLIHPSASFGRGQRAIVEAQVGMIVCAGVRLTNNIKVGDHCVFNLNATVGHDVVIDSFVNIAPGATVSGNVHLGQCCWIGTGAAINQGTAEALLQIGGSTTVGSGAVVVKDCEPNAVYAGVPAKRIK